MNDTTNPVSESGPWSLGTLIAFPIAALVALGLLGLSLYLFAAWHKERGSYHDDDLWVPATGLLIGALVVGGFTAFAMWPYDSEFHQWRTVSGEVEQVESRLIADGDGMSERYIVTIEGRPFGVDDTRAALLSEGDTVSLRCKREWQYAADSGWGCRWGHMTEVVR